MITNFEKLVQPCGCIFALKNESDYAKHVWIYVSPNCTIIDHHIETDDDE